MLNQLNNYSILFLKDVGGYITIMKRLHPLEHEFRPDMKLKEHSNGAYELIITLFKPIKIPIVET